MEFTRETVEHIAKLSKLEFDDDKLDAFQSEFIKIMDHFENLSDVKLEDVDINDLEGKKSPEPSCSCCPCHPTHTEREAGVLPRMIYIRRMFFIRRK